VEVRQATWHVCTAEAVRRGGLCTRPNGKKLPVRGRQVCDVAVTVTLVSLGTLAACHVDGGRCVYLPPDEFEQ
jgi:hypothetical protein